MRTTNLVFNIILLFPIKISWTSFLLLELPNLHLNPLLLLSNFLVQMIHLRKTKCQHFRVKKIKYTELSFAKHNV